jgi:hypothetical protein
MVMFVEEMGAFFDGSEERLVLFLDLFGHVVVILL